MAKNIEQLLHSKRLSGEEVGKAIIISLSNDYARVLDPSIAPLFSQEDLERMKNSLRTEYDIDIYNCYVNLENTLRHCQMTSQGNYQQALNGIYRLTVPLSLAHYALDVREVIDSAGEQSVKDQLEVIFNRMDALTDETDMQDAVSSRDVLLLPAVKEVYAYNAFFGAVADEYGLSEVSVFKIDTSPLEEQLRAYNAVSDFLARRFTEAGDELRKKKAAEIFTEIRNQQYLPGPEAVSAARRHLRDITVFNGSTRFIIELLMPS